MLTLKYTLVALGIIPVVIVRVFIFIKTETKNVEKNSNIQITTWSFAVVKEIVLLLCLNIYFSLELCLNLTMGLQQPAFRTTQSCLRQALYFFLCKKKKRNTIIPISQKWFLCFSKKFQKKLKEVSCCNFLCVSLEDTVLSSQHNFPSGFKN